jgi:hypothetical protein
MYISEQDRVFPCNLRANSQASNKAAHAVKDLWFNYVKPDAPRMALQQNKKYTKQPTIIPEESFLSPIKKTHPYLLNKSTNDIYFTKLQSSLHRGRIATNLRSTPTKNIAKKRYPVMTEESKQPREEILENVTKEMERQSLMTPGTEFNKYLSMGKEKSDDIIQEWLSSQRPVGMKVTYGAKLRLLSLISQKGLM